MPRPYGVLATNYSVVGYATSWLQQRSTRRTSCVPAPWTSAGAQRRRQTDTSIFSVWAHHTDAARPSLAAVCGTHRRLQAGSARLPMPARSGLWSHGIFATTSSASPSTIAATGLTLQSLSSLQLVIRCTPLSTVSDCRFGGWKPHLEKSAAWHHYFLRCFFSEPPQNWM